jgi:hypothetical protein
MPVYTITMQADQQGAQREAAAEKVVVQAPSASAAREFAKSQFPLTPSVFFDVADVSEVSPVTLASLAGVGSFYVKISDAAAQGVTILEDVEIEVPITSDDDTLAEIVTAFDAAFLAAFGGDADTVLYNADTRVITLEGADVAIGDAVIVAEFRVNGVVIPGLAPTVSAASSASTDRTLTFPNYGQPVRAVPCTFHVEITGGAAQDGSPIPATIEADVEFDLVAGVQDDFGDAIAAALLASADGTAGDVVYDDGGKVVVVPGANLEIGDATISFEVRVDGIVVAGLNPFFTTHEGDPTDDLVFPVLALGNAAAVAGAAGDVPQLLSRR